VAAAAGPGSCAIARVGAPRRRPGQRVGLVELDALAPTLQEFAH
jgi:hypothetical protein